MSCTLMLDMHLFLSNSRTMQWKQVQKRSSETYCMFEVIQGHSMIQLLKVKSENKKYELYTDTLTFGELILAAVGAYKRAYLIVSL